MSDKEGTTDQASKGATDQASNTDQSSMDQASTAKTVKELPQWAQDELRTARKEAGDYRTKLQKFEDENKSELQKAIDKAAELEKLHGETANTLRQERAERLVLTALSKANVNPEVLDLIADRVVRELAFDDAGQPTNVNEAINAVRKERPRLFAAAAGSGDGGKNGGTTKDGNQVVNDFIRQSAAR